LAAGHLNSGGGWPTSPVHGFSLAANQAFAGAPGLALFETRVSIMTGEKLSAF